MITFSAFCQHLIFKHGMYRYFWMNVSDDDAGFSRAGRVTCLPRTTCQVRVTEFLQHVLVSSYPSFLILIFVYICVLFREETHKVDVIKFAQNKAQECMRNDDLIDKDSALLIWEFIVLLCRQNGVCTRVCPCAPKTVLFSFLFQVCLILIKVCK